MTWLEVMMDSHRLDSIVGYTRLPSGIRILIFGGLWQAGHQRQDWVGELLCALSLLK